ncbi:hypothetical protein MMC16_003346 [Acarospora aff. strigata]|nr:hypothetical protein [Acarospora aff. strigata]
METSSDLDYAENANRSKAKARSTNSLSPVADKSSIVASEDSWFEVGSGILFTPSATAFGYREISTDPGSAVVLSRRECNSNSRKGNRRRVGRNSNAASPTREECTTANGRGTSHAAAATPGSQSERDRHGEETGGLTGPSENEIFVPGPQSESETLLRYTGSPLLEDPWSPWNRSPAPSDAPDPTQTKPNTSPNDC